MSQYKISQNTKEKKIPWDLSSHGGEYVDVGLLRCDAVFTWNIEARCSAKMLVPNNKSTWFHNPEGQHLQKDILFVSHLLVPGQTSQSRKCTLKSQNVTLLHQE
jgi:hypothetical protein